jgi:hypothetical protein
MTQEKVGLRIVELIHDITQLDYEVQFCPDFEGMIRLEFRNEYDGSFYQHFHLGSPDGTRNQLEKQIIQKLATFLDNAKEGKVESEL